MSFIVDDSINKEISQLRSLVKRLEERVYDLEAKLEDSKSLEKSHLLRVKNQDELSDDYILKGHKYLDLSPEKAFRLYNDFDNDFILLDVSKPIFQPFQELPEVRKITLEDLEMSSHLIGGKGKSIYVISEDGVRSILACKILNKLGFVNLNNISGGYKFWPGYRTISPTEDGDFEVA
jgi:rhodanese-related sulfurtransferase